MNQAFEQDLHFERGGPTYRLMQRIGLIRGDGPDVPRRIIAFLGLTWFPLIIFAAIQGRALGPTPRESFLLDFASYARFFVAMPVLIAAEAIIGPKLRKAALHFARSGLVRLEDLPAMEEAAAKATRRTGSLPAEVILAGLAFMGSWYAYRSLYVGGGMTWHVIGTGNGVRLSLAGLWYAVLAVPLIQFLFYRWLWRLLIWTGFLRDMARLDLKLVPTHADLAGGLGFLGDAQFLFGVLSIALGSILSGELAFRLVYEGASVESYEVYLIAYLILSELVFFSPLLVFMPSLFRTRREGLLIYSGLVDNYNQAFQKKWVEGSAPEGETLLGSSDIQSLADLGNSFDRVRAMKPLPVSVQVVIRMAVMVALPVIPALALAMPVKDILKLLAKALL
jgi:hypothetical protein